MRDMVGERRERYFRLTDEAHAGLDALATRHGVTMTALLEGLGLLGRRGDPTIDEVIATAREIDGRRRSRRPRSARGE